MLANTESSKKAAIDYLQNEIASCVEHKDPEESAAFRQLSSWLYRTPPSSAAATSAWTEKGGIDRQDLLMTHQIISENALLASRMELFMQLTAHWANDA